MCGSYPSRASTSTTCEPMKPAPPVTRMRRPLPCWLALSVEVGMGDRSRRGGKTLVAHALSVPCDEKPKSASGRTQAGRGARIGEEPDFVIPGSWLLLRVRLEQACRLVARVRFRLARKGVDLAGVERERRLAEPLAERRQVDAPPHRAATPGTLHRLDDLRLCLEDLVAAYVAQHLAREPDQPEAGEVVEVGMHAVELPHPRLGTDHAQSRLDQLGVNRAQRSTGAHVHRRLRSLEGEQPEDPGLVGRELFEDAYVGGMRLVVVVELGRAPEKLGAPRAHAGRAAAAVRHGLLGDLAAHGWTPTVLRVLADVEQLAQIP